MLLDNYIDCMSKKNNNYSNISENNDKDNNNSNNNHNKSQLLGARKKGDHKNGLKLGKVIFKQMIINPHFPQF